MIETCLLVCLFSELEKIGVERFTRKEEVSDKENSKATGRIPKGRDVIRHDRHEAGFKGAPNGHGFLLPTQMVSTKA